MKMNLTNVTQSLRLREYYYMLARHKALFSFVVAACLMVSVVLIFVLPKEFRAETVLLIQDKDILNPLISGLAISPTVNARMRTLRDELLSWQRLTLLAERLKLNKDVKNPVEYERLIKNLREHLNIRLRGTDLISIGFEGQDPKKAQEIVQNMSDIVSQGTLTSQKIEANSAIQFIQEQLKGYRDKLEKSEVELRKFKELYNSTLPVATGLNTQLVQLKIELNNLLAQNTEEHPRVIQTRKLIEQIEKQRDEFVDKAKKEGVAIDSTEDYGKLISSVPLQEQQLAKLQRDYAVNSHIYETFLQRLETAKISETLEMSDNGLKFRVLEPARLPLEPVKPNKILIILGGLVCGIGLGGILTYLIELSDTSIRNLDEARMLLELPIFGFIPPIHDEELLVQENLRKAASV